MTNLSVHLVERLARLIAGELQIAAPGHCLRVDHLGQDEAMRICQDVRELSAAGEVESYVLVPSGNGGPLGIKPERAIELRNRKQAKLCVFVPVGLVEATASSLTNSFAMFDLQDALDKIARELLNELPDDLRLVARQVAGTLRGPARCAPEHWAEYLSILAGGPSTEAAGAELWRVGLIPDVGSEGLVDRLERTRRCVLQLTRPARAQTSAEERLAEVGLRRGAVYDELLAYLQDKRLRDARVWLEGMAREPYRGRITFEKWTFAALSPIR